MAAQWTPAQRAEVLALLDKYGRHPDGCPLAWPPTPAAGRTTKPPCSCGLDAARAELARGG